MDEHEQAEELRRARISAAQRKRWKVRKLQAAAEGKTYSHAPEHCAAISAGQQRRWEKQRQEKAELESLRAELAELRERKAAGGPERPHTG